MPKYLTISDDLQIITGEGCRFLSKSAKDLSTVESEVEDWVEINATHPRRKEAELWLNSAFDEMQDRISIEARKEAEKASINSMEKSIRQFVRVLGRSKGWSIEKIRREATRRAEWAAKLLNDDPDELVRYFESLRNKRD